MGSVSFALDPIGCCHVFKNCHIIASHGSIVQDALDPSLSPILVLIFSSYNL